MPLAASRSLLRMWHPLAPVHGVAAEDRLEPIQFSFFSHEGDQTVRKSRICPRRKHSAPSRGSPAALAPFCPATPRRSGGEGGQGSHFWAESSSQGSKNEPKWWRCPLGLETSPGVGQPAPQGSGSWMLPPSRRCRDGREGQGPTHAHRRTNTHRKITICIKKRSAIALHRRQGFSPSPRLRPMLRSLTAP